jgi:lactoylglutathione lyase
MKIEHIAIWTRDIETMKDFYVKYFDLEPGKIYHNPNKGFSSYFLRFSSSETRIELMHRDSVSERSRENSAGFAHIAISTGGRDSVNKLTEILRTDGYKVISEPRTTGDGYYESSISDPEGNLIELTE